MKWFVDKRCSIFLIVPRAKAASIQKSVDFAIDLRAKNLDCVAWETCSKWPWIGRLFKSWQAKYVEWDFLITEKFHILVTDSCFHKRSLKGGKFPATLLQTNFYSWLRSPSMRSVFKNYYIKFKKLYTL